jgi:hypothetical protein
MIQQSQSALIWLIVGNEYTITVHNNYDSSDSIREVRIYRDVDGDGYPDQGIVNFECGLAPDGWTLDDRTELYQYCQYETTIYGGNMIDPNETETFTFLATLENITEQCGNSFKVATIDDVVPIGQVVFKFPFIWVDCSDPVLYKEVEGPQLGPCPPGEGEECWVMDHETDIHVQVYDHPEYDECNTGLDYCIYRIYLDGTLHFEHMFDPEETTSGIGWTLNFTEDSVHTLEIICEDIAGNVMEDVEIFRVDSTPPITRKWFEGPQKIIPGEFGTIEWIDGVTQVWLDAVDPDPTGYECNIGVDKTWYMNVIDLTENACYMPDEFCYPISGEVIPSPYDTEGMGCINAGQDWCYDFWAYDPTGEPTGYSSWEECVEDFAHYECRVDPLWQLWDAVLQRRSSRKHRGHASELFLR